MKQTLSVLALLLLASPAFADEAKKPDQPITLSQQDIADLNTVLTEQVPSRWAAPVIDWANKIIRREQMKAAEAEKKAEPDKTASAPQPQAQAPKP